jgi:hypothetical protein
MDQDRNDDVTEAELSQVEADQDVTPTPNDDHAAEADEALSEQLQEDAAVESAERLDDAE